MAKKTRKRARPKASNPTQVGKGSRAKFVDEYMIDLNATQAAIRAGYSPKTAGAQGSRLLKRVDISAQVAARRKEQSDATGFTAQKVLKELALIGFANMADYMRVGPEGLPVLDFSALTREQAAVLTEVTVEETQEGPRDNPYEVRKVKFKLADKRAALVDLGKHLGLFIDRVDHTTGGDPLPDEIRVKLIRPSARR
jgi:phage terminase small subunit